MKKLILPLFAMLFLIACEKEASTDLVTDEVTYEDGSASERNPNKRDVCHNSNIINININAIPAHQAHGDAVDMDGDGYFDMENNCGMPVDCDDTDGSVNAENNNCPVCTLPPYHGPCDAAIPRWYYDSNSGTCQTFIYGGCQGNGNNFVTQTLCEQACSL